MLAQLPEFKDPNILVGMKNADDAGVYRLTDELALVLTADFFTPIVDDAYAFGAIAAANALSDVWAMGGRAITSLNVAMFPAGPDYAVVLGDVMRGGIEKMAEAGVSVIGGHTIKDKEPKFGFAVMGLIHPDKILDNTKALAGDAMILTKKIGTGIIATGVKGDRAAPDGISEFTSSMMALNKRASEIMVEVGVSTATDITGFGLLGHMHEVLSASGRAARVYVSRVPCFDEARRLLAMGIAPGGTKENLSTFDPYIQWGHGVTRQDAMLLCDAQTSGGLLIFVPRERKDALVAALESDGILAAHIGDVLDVPAGGAKKIFVESG